jgi:hypothetical protein
MSDLVIKDFDRKAGTAFIWTAGAMLAFALAVPFHYAIHFAVAPAADILTGFATDNGVRDLAAIQRAAAFAFALPGILLFSVALLAGATVIGALGFELKGERPVAGKLLLGLPIPMVVCFGVLAASTVLSLPMMDAVQTWGVPLAEEVQLFANAPTAFWIMAASIAFAAALRWLKAYEAGSAEEATA